MNRTTTATAPTDERAALLAVAVADYPTFCRTLIRIVPKEHAPATFLRLNAIQRKFHDARTGRDLVVKPRQIGKTTEANARNVWRFLQSGQRVIVVCQSVTGNGPLKKLSEEIRIMLEGLKHAGIRLDFGRECETLWTLPGRNSSLQIVEAGASEAAASKKGRSGTYTRVHVTEAAFFEHPEKTLNAIFEGVPHGPHTEIEIESTPKGAGTWFHQQFISAQAGENGYRAHFFPWYDTAEYALPLSPGERIEPQNEREDELVRVYGVAPEQLKWWRAKVNDPAKGLDLTDQEYPGDPVRCFLKSGRLFFDAEKINAMNKQNAPIEVRTGAASVLVWSRRRVGCQYVIGVDAAEGLGEDGDWTYATVWERRTNRHVATLRTQLRENESAAAIDSLAREYGNALIVVERNKGMAIIGALEGIKRDDDDPTPRPQLYYDQDQKPGIFTSTTSRPLMLSDLAGAVRDGSLVTDDPTLVAEMSVFVIDHRTGRPHSPTKGRKKGTGDDGIFSAAMAWAVLLRPEPTVAVHTGGARSFGGGEVDAFGAPDPWASGRGW